MANQLYGKASSESPALKPYRGKPAVRVLALSDAYQLLILAGVNPAGGTCPVATVVISGGGASDQPVESPEVKASVGWGQPGQLRQGSKQIDRS